MRISGIPDYHDLDVSGEARAAAGRMEARAREPASEEMFDYLVRPLLEPAPRTVLEVGCGTAAMSRHVARLSPGTAVYATDKSVGMLAAAREHAEAEAPGNLHLGRWDVLDPAAFPFASVGPFDLVLSSVVVPYLDDRQTAALVGDLSSRLAPGGALVFVEQDLQTDAVNYPDFDLLSRVYARDARALDRTMSLGLRPLLRGAGLDPLPRRSFLWTDEAYGPYTRELLGSIADAAREAGRITDAERREWGEMLDGLAAAGDFYYGLVYHRIAGRRSGGGS